ncbi:hypothetical protein [Methanococcoides sp. FTZ1]|uniref:hypothetical protein n=1 Tax=Methanococcoides sp. FTZ1 TaxID=3439061 RepID=UPI003F83CBC2
MQNQDYHDIASDALEHIKSYSDGSQSVTSAVVGAEVTDTISEEEFIQAIVTELKPFMHDSMTTDEFYKLLKKYFGLASR